MSGFRAKIRTHEAVFMIRFLFASAIFAVAFSAPSQAEAAPIRCDTCQKSVDFRLIAEAQGPGTHVIFNLDTGKMETWRIPGGDGIARQPSATQAPDPTRVTNNPAAQRELDKAHELYLIDGNSLRRIYNVPVSRLNLPATDGRTIHDVLRDSTLRNQLASAASDALFLQSIADGSFMTSPDEFLNPGTASLNLRDQVETFLRVVMLDGSHIDIRINIDENVGLVLMDTARTAAGQYIPADLSHTNGTWNQAGGDDLAKLADHMRQLGATVTSVGPVQGFVKTIVCVAGECTVTRSIQ